MIENKIIAEILKEFSEWAVIQTSSRWHIEMFKDLFINDLHSNVNRENNIRDKIYWIDRCTSHFEEKFEVKMPVSIRNKIYRLKLLKSFQNNT